MKWTKEQYDKYQARQANTIALKAHNLRVSSTKPEPDVRNGTLAKKEAKGHHPLRGITVSSYRARLCDPDNLCVKPFIDALRYCGVISDDTSLHVAITIKQYKVKTRKEERTVIDII